MLTRRSDQPGVNSLSCSGPSHSSRRTAARSLLAIALMSFGGTTALGYTVTDFKVDAAHACLGDQHEVSCPDFNNFDLTIYGTFNPSKCYQVKIKRSGGSDCGSANASGTDTCVAYANRLECEIHNTANSDFKSADNWVIEIKERNSNCSGNPSNQDFPDSPNEPYLRIAGCNDTCLLYDSDIAVTPNPAGCGDVVQVCATADGSGNFEYYFDLNGNGVCGVCSGGSSNGGPCVAPVDCPGGACMGGTGFTDVIKKTGDPGCPPDQPCCVTFTPSATTTVGVRVRDLGTETPCSDQCQKVVVVFNGNADCDDGLYCNGVETCSNGNCVAGTPPNCNDGISCTVDSCDETNNVCKHVANNAACNDGQYCNGSEVCNLTQGCKPGTAPNCSDGVACTTDTCNEANDTCVHTTNNAACNDGQFCNGTETCHITQGCKAGTPVNCADAFSCTTDSCDESTDSCKHKPVNSACNDGLYCNGVESCSATQGCIAGSPPNCSDNVSCTTDACNESNDTCSHTTNNTACNDGLYCNGTETCHATQGCKPGTAITCSDGVACTTDACNEATDSCSYTPNNAACNDNQYCNGVEVCNLTQGCKPGTAVNCSDGIACTTDACNESNDTCTHKPVNSSCNDGQYCNGVETCSATQGCVAGTAPNCNDNVACTTDSCNETNDTCVNTTNNAACSDGQYCNGAETCHATQGCKPGTAPNCADSVPCTVDACNEANDTCTHTVNNAACNDGLFCNGAETCHATNGCQPGTAPNCNDNVACTTDACNETNDNCTHTPNHGSCSDSLFCNGAEFCDPVLGCKDAADPCAPPLQCNESGDVCVSCLNNSQCNDGLFCNGVETCVNGTCQSGTPPTCNDSIACTTDSCNPATDSCAYVPNHATCNDGAFCNGVEACSLTQGCVAGTPINCNDNVSCTTDSCNEATDACVHTTNNAACSDGQYCNGAEVCHATQGCKPGTAPNCSDGVACTVDSCNESTDSCNNVPNHTACSDGQYCDGNEVCDPVNGCKEGTPVNCNDNVACTLDSCNEATDSCNYVTSNALCSDNLHCNGVETCHATNGCQPGAAPNCNDNIACTTDTCNEATDSCAHAPVHASCNDGAFCNGVEICDPAQGCKPGSAPNCNDGVACTADSCDEVNDDCDHVPNHTSCSNGNFCDGEEVCDSVLGCRDSNDPCNAPRYCLEASDACVECLTDADCGDALYCNGAEVCNLATHTCGPGTPPNCSDSVNCTADACDEATDTCTHVPSDQVCNNGLFCDGTETCHLTNGCQPGTAPNCADTVPCTIDACDEAADLCTHTPDNTVCGNGLFCDGAEYCDPQLGCQDNLDPCNDPLYCDESIDQCVFCLTNAQCNDGLFCNGAETCVNGTCQPGTAPACDDGLACTSDFCSPATDMCAHTPNHASCDDGQYCNGSEVCDLTSGCQSGTAPVCNDTIPCTVDACDEATDSCTHTPNSGTCNDGLYCNGSEVCDAIQGCLPGMAPNCSDGIGCTTDACDEATDSCTHAPQDSACNDGVFCDGVEICHPTLGCQEGPAPDCSDSVPCTVDACDPSSDACVHTPDNSTCVDALYCNGVEYCHPTFGCQAGTPPSCSDNIACTTDTCNEATDSCDHAPQHAPCSDNLYCNGSEVCDPAQGCVPGMAPNCSDGVGCTTDVCNEATDSCDHSPVDGACDDGQFCNGDETCDVLQGCRPGTAPDCGDSVGCTVDTCNENTDTCDHVPNGTLCDDGQYCNGVEYCTLQGCQPGTAPNCDDLVACTVDSCDELNDDCDHVPDHSFCNDFLFCDGLEFCDPQLGCQDAPDPCAPPTMCEEATDQCVNCMEDAHCNDNLFCNGEEACVSGICQPGTPPTCEDGVPCTVDSCDPSTDACIHTPNNSACGDGQYCNGVEVCDALAGCQPGTAPDCSDTVTCTVDSCDEATDSCVHTPNHAPCSDNLYCNGSEVCDLVLGCQPGAAPNCNDGVACTVDVCNEATDSCTHATDPSTCNDNLYCNGVEVCDPINGCQPGTPPVCGDSVACTIDACDEATDSCTHTPNSGTCTDGLYCNGSEVCDVLQGCIPGTPPNCADAIDCTVDTCNEATDSCLHTPNDVPCSNGAYCDGAESCNPQTGCQPGAPIVCADGVACTVDTCDEVNDRCVSTPNPVLCSDGAYCNGNEVCDPSTGCSPGMAPNCNDAIGCTTDSCDEATDMCVHQPVDSICNDGKYCNGAETCGPSGCTPGSPVNCADNVACTVDSCDESTDLCVHTQSGNLCDDADPCTQDVCMAGGCLNQPICGACCLKTGDCVDGVSQSECESQGNSRWNGLGTLCAGDDNGNGRDDLCEIQQNIPTVSQWGLAVLALLMLIGAKVRFGRSYNQAV